MDDKHFFDFNAYMAKLARQNRLAASHGFVACTCTGIDGLQGIMDDWQTAQGFICSDDVTTGETIREGGGWFQRRTFTVFILQRYEYGDENDRQAKLSLCREVLRQMQSRLVRDRDQLGNDLVFLRVEAMPTTEMGQYFASGCTGLYFMVTVDEPVTLIYDGTEWDEQTE